jgi:hypothetical protein
MNITQKLGGVLIDDKFISFDEFTSNYVSNLQKMEDLKAKVERYERALIMIRKTHNVNIADEALING